MHDLALKAAALDPAQIGAQQHVGPITRLGSTGARRQGDNGVAAIKLTAEKAKKLEIFQLLEDVVPGSARFDQRLAIGARFLD